MEELAEDMQANYQINMTKLFADFSKLKETIDIEALDVKISSRYHEENRNHERPR
jgi:hypothetical protein